MKTKKQTETKEDQSLITFLATKYIFAPILIDSNDRKMHKRMFSDNFKALKPLQNKKGQKNLGYPRKKQSFYKEKDCFFLGYPTSFSAVRSTLRF